MILKSKNSRKISFNPDTCDKDSLNICQDQKGVALIEFAVVTPFITALLLGCIDLTYYLVAHQRISRSA
ncbi:MAG TPA: pilus assembly protein, partial [Emcibacteraceae bacterium]|nr:pilus assembly protein [Emcibacteraceae bacterium]